MKIDRSVKMERSREPIEGRYATLEHGMLREHEISSDGLVVWVPDWSPFKIGDQFDLTTFPLDWWGWCWWWESQDSPPDPTGDIFTYDQAMALLLHDAEAIKACGAQAGTGESRAGAVTLREQLVRVGDRVTCRCKPIGEPGLWPTAFVVKK